MTQDNIPTAKRTKTLEDDVDNLSDEERKWFGMLQAKFDGFDELHKKDLSISQGQSQKPVELACNLDSLLSSTDIHEEEGVPKAEHQRLPFSYLLEQLEKDSPSSIDQGIKDIYSLAHILFDNYEDQFSLDLPSSRDERARFMPLVRKDRLSKFLSTYILRKNAERIALVETENPTAAALLKLSAHDIKGACDSLQKAKNYKLMLLVSQLERAGQSWQAEIKAQIDAWRDQGVLSEISEDVRAIYEVCAGNVTICLGKSAPNVPVEDKAKTFAISEEYGLDWIQVFAMGMWYGSDEKKATADGIVHIEDAVREFAGRCDRGEESVKPGDDVMWTLLQVFASLHGINAVHMPVFPQALNTLISDSDASHAFALHFAITSAVEGIAIDEAKADQLSALFAWQLSLNNDVPGAVFALLHIEDATSRKEAIEALLERFAASLPDPASDANTATDSPAWTTLTNRLCIPAAWIFVAKAVHARTTDPSGQQELEYLIAAQSWNDAHECLIRRVAPGCIVDADYQLLSQFVNLFTSANDIESQIPDWFVGGGVYADFAQLVNSQLTPKMDQDLLSSLAKRLTNLGRDFTRQGPVNLGTLPVEKLEERVAIMEMSKVVAEKLGSNTKEILDLPITSDLRLKYTLTLAGDYYRGVMAGGASSI